MGTSVELEEFANITIGHLWDRARLLGCRASDLLPPPYSDDSASSSTVFGSRLSTRQSA